METSATNPVKATRKSFHILQELEDGPKRIKELTETIDLQKGAIHNHLATLVEVGFVVQDGTAYRLSLEPLRIGGSLRHRMAVYQTAKPKIKQLARETGEIANLIVEERGLGVFILREQGDQAVQMNTPLGTTVELHKTAAGKAILANYDRDRVEKIVDRRGLDPATPRTVDTKSALLDELETIAERGYAVDRGELQEGICCVAFPVLNDRESVAGAISCSLPRTRLSGDELTGEFARKVENTANLTELELRY